MKEPAKQAQQTKVHMDSSTRTVHRQTHPVNRHSLTHSGIRQAPPPATRPAYPATQPPSALDPWQAATAALVATGKLLLALRVNRSEFDEAAEVVELLREVAS